MVEHCSPFGVGDVQYPVDERAQVAHQSGEKIAGEKVSPPECLELRFAKQNDNDLTIYELYPGEVESELQQ